MENYEMPISANEKDAFFDQLREKTQYCSESEYRREAKKLFGEVPLSGVCVKIDLARDKNSKELMGYDPESIRILVNKGYYEENFSRDYTEMIPYDLEHENWELYYCVKKGYNPDTLDVKEGRDRHFGKAHNLAIRRALEKAWSEGNLDKYLDFMKEQLETLDPDNYHREYSYYEKQAEKLRE
jgi:hypothetical protein